jgi:hypothetical protein
MTFYQDLEPIDYFPINRDVVMLAVGWLGKEFKFQTGKVSWQFYNKLCEFVENPWQPFLSSGFHFCELCQFYGSRYTATGSSNLFVPFNNVIYVAPELIVHYINVHHYQPPEIFIDAVMECPYIQTMEYKRCLLKNGGKELIMNKLAN